MTHSGSNTVFLQKNVLNDLENMNLMIHRLNLNELDDSSFELGHCTCRNESQMFGGSEVVTDSIC